MQENTVGHQGWRAVRTLGFSHADLQTLILACGNALSLRISPDIDEPATLEVLCSDEEEYTRTEAMLHQAVADHRLRQRILSQSATEIAAVVDGVLARAVKG